MINVIRDYCDNKDIGNGLFLLDMPTGFGKTYSVLEYIYNAVYDENNDGKKFFFITTLKKNLPTNELKERFVKDKRLSDFKDKFLFINSNAECVIENLTNDLISRIPNRIKRTDEYRLMESDVKFIQSKSTDTNTDVKRMVTKTKDELRIKSEPKFRNYISRLLAGEFLTVQTRLQAIKTNAEWQWLGELYPAVFTRDKQIIFMSIDKFMTRNATIVEPSYMFYNSKIIDGAVIFIDEFDATKDTVLKTIIQNGIDYKTDFLELFQDIYAALQVKEFPTALTVPSKQRNESKYSGQSLQSIIDGFKEKAEEIYGNYCLKFSHRTDDEEQVNNNFLFQDHVFHSILNGNKKFISVSHDKKYRINRINFTEEKPLNTQDNIFYMIGKLRGFIKFFQRGVNILACNYLQLKQESPNGNEVEFTREGAIRSVLNEFGLNKHHIDYLTSMILTSSHKTNALALSDYDLSFYEKGFRYFSFENDISHDMQSKIMLSEFQNTPEKILLRFCEKAKIIGISATATVPSVIGNYDINYLKSRLQQSFMLPNREEKQNLNENYNTHIKGYDKVNINVELFDACVDSGYSKKSWEQIFNDRELAEYVYNKVEQKQSSDGDNSYNKERYVRVAYAYKQFIVHDDIKSFLCMLTKHPRRNDVALDIDILNEIFQYIYKENESHCSSKFNVQNTYIQLDGEEYDDKKDEIVRRLSKGEKLFVISVYQTMGAGQNIQYTIPKDEQASLIKMNDLPSRNEKDFDAIYLDKPTNLLVNLDNGLSEEDFAKYIFQIEFLQEKSEISSELAVTHIKKAFRCFSTQSNFNLPYAESVYKRRSVILLATRTIIQAIGRICRTNLKKPNIYIFADSKLKEWLDKNVSKDRLLNPEFIALINKICDEKQKESVYSSLESAGSLLSVRVNTFINNLLREDWTEDRIKKWGQLREITLKYPTVTKEEVETNVILNNFYVKLPNKLSKIYYQQQNDYSAIRVSFDKSFEFPLEVSEQSARLPELMQIQGVKELFEKEVGQLLLFLMTIFNRLPCLIIFIKEH